MFSVGVVSLGGTGSVAVNSKWSRTVHRAVKSLPDLVRPRAIQSPRRNAFASSSKAPPDAPKSKDWHNPPPPPPTLSKQTQSPYNDPITRLKHPMRGGRDLGARYVRLERALRGKEEYERDIEGMESGEVEEGDEKRSGSVGGRGKGKGKVQIMFAGFVIPEVPKPPEPDECCMSGCAICVHDLYAEALEAHRNALVSIRSALSEKGVNEETWPDILRTASSNNGEGGKAKEATLSAFEQMELQLAARRTQAPLPNSEVEKKKLDGSLMKSETDIPRHGSNSHESPAGRPVTRRNKSDGIDAKAVLEALSWVLFSRR